MDFSVGRRGETLFVCALALVAFAFRLYGAGSVGFNNDEAFKWWAVHSYQQGHFVGVNCEHPMLMKLLVWGSLRLGLLWNQLAAGHPSLGASLEIILRMPNLIIGALTSVVLYFFGKELIGRIGGGAAAIFWAVLPLPIAINRLLKEDTLLIFFTYLAFHFFLRAKKVPREETADRFFMLSGGCFGLALASKYYLHYLGLNFLFWHVAGGLGLDPRALLKTSKRGLAFLLAGCLTFVLANFVILSPANDTSILRYMNEKTLLYNGQNLNGHMYMTTFSSTPFGMPVYFYVWMLGIKTPLTVLVAIVSGVILALRTRRSLATLFLQIMLFFYFVPISLINPKTIRYLGDMLPFLFLAAGYAIEKAHQSLRQVGPVEMRFAFIALASVALVVYPVAESVAVAPYFTLYVNPLGGSKANFGKFFPYDEVADLGVKESVEFICRSATHGVRLAANSQALVQLYVERCGRNDIELKGLFNPRYVVQKGDLVILQDSRRYFETEDLSALVRRHGRLLREIKLDGLIVASIYQF